MRRRPGLRHRRPTAPRSRRTSDQGPEGPLAPRRDRRRRQDRRRRRRAGQRPAGLLHRPGPSHGPRPALGPDRGRPDLPAAHRPGRPGSLPHDRRGRSPAFRLLHLWLASGAGRHLGDRREGQRHPSGNRADHAGRSGRPGRRGAGARPVPVPQAHRKARSRPEHQRLLHLLAVGQVADLQGHVPRRAHRRVLPRPEGRALRRRRGDLPPALLDQHLPAMAPGPALPDARPQRRDQYDQGQRQLDEVPRDQDGRPGLR